MTYLTVFWVTSAGVLRSGGIFFGVMVGGVGGLSGPKELMGWVVTVTDGRSYPHPAPRSTEVEALVFYNMSNVLVECEDKSEPAQFISLLVREVVPEAHRRHWQFYETICKSNLRRCGVVCETA